MTDLPAPIAPVPSVLGTKLTEAQIVKLAREIAVDMRNLSVVLTDYNITEEEYKILEANPQFAKLVEMLKQEWNGADKTHERIRLKAAAGLEDALPMLTLRAGDKGEDLGKAVEAGKLLKSIAAINEERGGIASGDKFSITINLGEDKKITFEKNITPTPPVLEQEALPALTTEKSNE